MAEHEKAFSGAVLVYQGGKVRFSRAYGLADRERKVALVPDSLFHVASISKTFTAVAVLKLEQMGRFDIDDPIVKHLDGVPEDKRAITIRQVLGHVSGLPYGLGKGKDAGAADNYSTQSYGGMLDRILQCRLAAPPGRKYVYSNLGYRLLAMLVETVANRPFERFLQEEVLDPAGLTRTGFAAAFPLTRETLTRGYSEGKDLGPCIAEDLSWQDRGPAHLLTCTGDLLRWHLALQGEAVLGAAAKARMYAPQLNQYACGWHVARTSRGSLNLWHDGLVPGFYSRLNRYVDDDACVVILANTDEVRADLSDALERILLRHLEDGPGEDLPAPEPPPAYEVPSDLLLEGLRKDGSVETRVRYLNGRREGVFQSFSAEGILVSEVPYREGRVCGPLKEYAGDRLKSESTWVADGTGTFTAFHSDGGKRVEIRYRDWRRVGKELRYDREGKVVREIPHDPEP